MRNIFRNMFFSNNENFLTKKDRSLRLWERSEDQLVVLEEEEQRQREEEAKNAFMSEEQSAGTVIPGANPEGMSQNMNFWGLKRHI